MPRLLSAARVCPVVVQTVPSIELPLVCLLFLLHAIPSCVYSPHVCPFLFLFFFSVSGWTFSEVSVCSYLISGKSKAACGVTGDPYDGYYDSPADSFGYTVLGSVLTIAVYWFIVFGMARGWFDVCLRNMPSWLKCGAGGGSSGGFAYSSGSYKAVAGGTTATPITASAYGSAGGV